MKTLLSILLTIALMLVVWIPKAEARHRTKTRSKTVTVYQDGVAVSSSVSSSSSSRGGSVGYYVQAAPMVSYSVASPRVYYAAPRVQARVYAPRVYAPRVYAPRVYSSACPDGYCPPTVYSSGPVIRSKTTTKTKTYSRSR